MGDDIYEVYAVRYGHSARRSPENFIGGDAHDVDMPLDYFVWAIVGEKQTFVVDTGFNAESGGRRGREFVLPVADGLRAIGIDPGTVEDVIITHMHYDHAGNNDLFPRARFHVQDCEMQFVTGRCMCHHVLRHSFEVEDVVGMVRRVYADKVRFHDGTSEIAPGITLHHIGGHSKGLQSVRVKTRRGHVVIASDAAHFYRHLDERRVFPTVHSLEGVLEGYDTVERLATSKDHIVPGHDPLVLALYPAATPGLEAIAARLDLEPKRRDGS